MGDGNTHVTGVMNFYHRNSIFNRDRGYSAVPPFLSTQLRPLKTCSCTYESVVEAGGTPPAGFVPYLAIVFFGRAPFGSDGQ